jgi:type II secretory pathway component PulM
LIEMQSLLGKGDETVKAGYFKIPKGAAFSGVLKESLSKFNIKYSDLSVQDGASFVASVTLYVENMEDVSLWLNFVRKQYALRPMELTMAMGVPPRAKVGSGQPGSSEEVLKVSVRLQGLRI